MPNRNVNKLRILLALEETEFQAGLSEALVADGSFEFVESADNATDGLKIVQGNTLDVVLIDLGLPSPEGGLFMLDELKKRHDNRPVCITLSNADQDNLRRKALQLGADYSIIKPVDISLLVGRIKEIFDFKRQTSFRSQASSFPEEMEKDSFIEYALTKIPIAANLKGFSYLQVGIALAIDDMGILRRVTKSLYPQIAYHFNSSASRVERAMRHAIDLAWAKGNAKNYIALTGTPLEGKPSNSTFIGTIAQLYHQKYRKR
jgi:two-component system response regulator (stage 0 sporulation protein A)